MEIDALRNRWLGFVAHLHACMVRFLKYVIGCCVCVRVLSECFFRRCTSVTCRSSSLSVGRLTNLDDDKNTSDETTERVVVKLVINLVEIENFRFYCDCKKKFKIQMWRHPYCLNII